MRIVAIYGDDELKARNRYSQIIDGVKKRGWEHVSLVPDQKISAQVVGVSLFGAERLYSCDKAVKIAPKEYEWINAHSSDHNGRLLLLFGLTIPAAIKKLFPKDVTLEEFKLKKELFLFLENISPGNKQMINNFHRVIQVDPPELVLAMLGRHMRDLAWIKSSKSTFPGPSWRADKLSRQAERFSWDQLRSLVDALAEADIKSKTGLGELTFLLDLIFAKYM